MRAIFSKNTHKKSIFSREKAALVRFLLWQVIAAAVITMMVIWLANKVAAISTLLGGLLVIVPNVFLAFYIFASTKNKSPQKIARACYVGEALKIMLIAFLFMVMLRCCDVMLGPFLIGFCGTYGVYLVSAFL